MRQIKKYKWDAVEIFGKSDKFFLLKWEWDLLCICWDDEPSAQVVIKIDISRLVNTSDVRLIFSQKNRMTIDFFGKSDKKLLSWEFF